MDRKFSVLKICPPFEARFGFNFYRRADKSLAQPTSLCIFFNGENISFDASLVKYIYIIYTYTNSTNIPPIMIINGIYETQNLLLF